MPKQEKETGTGFVLTRRHALECMVWAGTGVLWTVAGGIPKSLSLLDAAQAAEAAQGAMTFLQISDSHVGFDKEAKVTAVDTLTEAIDKVNALPVKPAFMIHTGDITHLSKDGEFDDAARIIGSTGLDVFYVPGEHDVIDPGQGRAYLDRYGKGTLGAGWHSFDLGGVHFIGLVNVVDLKAGGLGNLGAEQLAWLKKDLDGRSASTPIVVFAHIPLWSIYPEWGWGTDDAAQALALLKRFGSVTVLNGHIHQIVQKVEGNMTFHTARSTAFPQPKPGTADKPGPVIVPADQLRSMLGLTSVDFTVGQERLAITDTTLA
ncbi:metallophosphoesterase [Mesorhizobium sp. KR2-14]|uniref:metallophosphoesterase family protein n=1 Tax=Mesorhizobium sp. KR2-14 TaxID=3156610 RepID=UPI0032B404A5